jgi:hypothetical protein
MFIRRAIVALAIAAATLPGLPVDAHGQQKQVQQPQQKKPVVTVYKTPTCGCCSDWMRHVEKAGFTVIGKDVRDVDPIKKQLGVPSNIVSCHTAVVEGYAIEGHVPLAALQRLLRERPKIKGIGVNGMPLNSLGMEGYGRTDPYDVVAFDAKGNQTVYQRVR